MAKVSLDNVTGDIFVAEDKNRLWFQVSRLQYIVAAGGWPPSVVSSFKGRMPTGFTNVYCRCFPVFARLL
jgi:hypothetical protein